ncbi:MAG: copper amine oxidase N-terminal domain-containing protein [Clostridia bacterium]|nr:copper amine oxidase N-terminal domain-containing protein [Clostridia bacterium]
MQRRVKQMCAAAVAVIAVGGAVCAAANTLERVEAYLDSVPIEYNGSETNVKALNYEDRIYLPIRDISGILGCEIEWNNDERSVTIENDEEKISGYEELEISEETAQTIADAIFLQLYGEDFFERNPYVEIWDRGNYYGVYRTFTDSIWTDGGGVVIHVRKSDGKVMDLEWQE